MTPSWKFLLLQNNRLFHVYLSCCVFLFHLDSDLKKNVVFLVTILTVALFVY